MNNIIGILFPVIVNEKKINTKIPDNINIKKFLLFFLIKMGIEKNRNILNLCK